ncbi:MAG: type 1 glutamine amidotransferase [Pseudomonadota bacterium]
MRVAIVENIRDTALGQVGVALDEAGAEITLFRPWADGRLPEGTEGHDALVVLGGEQSAVDDDRFPYLPRLARLMRAFGEADRAVLGICLGSQLLARAWGGANRLGAAPEFGWRGVELTEAGRGDPLLAGLPGAFPIFQWHNDTFTLPEGAVRLARNGAAENQAFRVGRASYGTQFHFEMSRSVIEAMARDWRDTMLGLDPDWESAYPARAAGDGVAADAAGLAIARAWVAQI